MYKNYLSHRVKIRIKQNHPDLVFSPLQSSGRIILEVITKPKSWWIVLIFTSLLFLISATVNVEMLKIISVSKDLANSFFDRRIGNIAVRISITLVVVGFLINNLAVKEIFTYRLLFKYTLLYPIFYFCLSVIGIFFIIAVIREGIPTITFINIALGGTYLSVLILFLIGFLFSVLIKFSDRNQVKNLMHRELMFESRNILIQNLKVVYSGKIFKESLENCGAEIYDFVESFDLGDFSFDSKDANVKRMQKQERAYVNDINLGKIERIIKRRIKKNPEQKVQYRMVRLGDHIIKSESFIWQSPKKDTFFENTLIKHFSFKNDSKYLNTNTVVKNYFQQKLKKSVESNDTLEVQEILDSFLVLYKLEMENMNQA